VSGDRGGAIRLLGDQVFVSGAMLDAAGRLGGGTVNVGGAFRGGASLPASQRTIMDANSVVRVSAIAQGNGGQAVLWSDGVTQFSGVIEGWGGVNGGNGAVAEVSGRSALGFAGTVDLSAPLGLWGSLLLDPETIQIVDGLAGSQPQDADLAAGNGAIAPGLTPNTFTISRGALEAVQGNILLEAQQDIQIAPGLGLDFPNPNVDPNETRQIEFRAISGDFMMDPSQVIRAPGQNVVITAGNRITLGSIDTSAVDRAGGAITLTAGTGGLAGLQSLLETDAENGDGGNVLIRADGDVTLNAISTLSSANFGEDFQAGTVDVASTQGNINLGLIDAQGFQGTGGQIRINASQGGVAIANGIQAFGSNAGGAIEITGSEIAVTGDLVATGGDGGIALAGTIDLAAIDAITIAGNLEAAGNSAINSLPGTPRISVVGAGAVTVDGTISTRGIDNGGDVLLQGASLALQSIDTSSGVGTGGNVQALATAGGLALDGSVETSGGTNVASAGFAGTVDLRAAGDLAITAGIIATGNTGSSPNSSTSTSTRVSLQAGDSLTVEEAIDLSGPNQGGDLRAIAGQINLQDIDARSPGTGGNLELQATTSDLVAGTLNVSGDLQAGVINLNAVGDILTQALQATSAVNGGGIAMTGNSILTGAIDTSSTNGAGGDVTLNSAQDTEVTTIRAEGNTAGGNITAIAGQLFRATGEFVAQDGQPASLSAIAPTSVTSPEGRISITYNGSGTTLFVIGRQTENGSLRPLRRGQIPDSVFDNGEYPVTVVKDGDRLALISVNPLLLPPPPPPPGDNNSNPCTSIVCQSAANIGLYNVLSELTGDLLAYEVLQQKLPLNLAELRQPVLTSEMPDELLLLTDSGRDQDALILIDRYFSQQYLELFSQDQRLENSLPPRRWVPVQEVQRQLREVEERTNQKIAVIYAMPTVEEDQQTEKLQLLFIASRGNTVTTSVDIDRDTITRTTRLLNQCISNDRSGRSESENEILDFSDLTTQDRGDLQKCQSSDQYLEYAQSLYQWLITPLQNSLDQFEIDSLVFSLGERLRIMPLATLHDGHHALINDFNIGILPSYGLLLDSNYSSLMNFPLRSFGIESFDNIPNNFKNLLFAKNEAELISDFYNPDNSEVFLESNVTLETFSNQDFNRENAIFHIATHALFDAVSFENSYIQLYPDASNPSGELRFSEFNQSRLGQPPLELLVLSACETAFTWNFDTDTQGILDFENDLNISEMAAQEMGFIGLSIHAGVKTAMGTLWSINDLSSALLMIKFHEISQSSDNITRAEALRQAQLALLRGDIRVENGELFGIEIPEDHPLRHTIQNRWSDVNFTHPFEWGGFVLLGTPW
jgi:CHAT domain-containing protein